MGNVINLTSDENIFISLINQGANENILGISEVKNIILSQLKKNSFYKVICEKSYDDGSFVLHFWNTSSNVIDLLNPGDKYIYFKIESKDDKTNRIALYKVRKRTKEELSILDVNICGEYEILGKPIYINRSVNIRKR